MRVYKYIVYKGAVKWCTSNWKVLLNLIGIVLFAINIRKK